MVNQETEPINEPARPMKGQVDVDEGNTKKIKELKKYVPTQNQPGEEDIEPIWEEKAKTPPFLLTLEVLNHNLHNCLVDSGSSVNVMPLEVYKNINGHPKPTTWEVVQLDRTSVKVVGEMKNVLLVVLPPDVVGRDVLVASDLFVSTVRFFFSRRLWLTIYIYGVDF